MLSPQENPKPVIPDHTLLRPIGRGSYGEVWLARNVMGAPRAVKIVWRRQFDSDRPFEREFEGIQRYEPVSRSADGLVHVLHVGRNDIEGYFYYVMELADALVGEPVDSRSDSKWDATVPVSDRSNSESLTTDPLTTGLLSTGSLNPGPLITDYWPRTLRSDLKRLGRLPIADCLRTATEAVGGLARLHYRGLVHRDVKPGNIIFVDGRAKLADIGLVSTESEGRTFVGTEGYIPPEGPGSIGADLYALGMVLYEASTGYPPERFPRVPPEWFEEEADPELLEFHEVVLKACEGAKERRYQSAEEMQADLAFLQSGQSVRQLRALEGRVRRWTRIGWAAALCVALALVTALVANVRAKAAAENQAKESRLLEQAQKSLTRAEHAERESHQQLHAALFEQARALVLSKELGHRTRALEALRRAEGATNIAEMRGVAFAALALPDLHFEREFQLDRTTTLAQPDPEFARIALCNGTGPVEIRSLPDLKPLTTLFASTNREAYGAKWSGDGRFLAVRRQFSRTRSIWEVWSVAEARRVVLTGSDAAYASATFHPHRRSILIGYAGGSVIEWDLESGRELRKFELSDTVHALAYSPDGSLIAACYRLDSGLWVVAIHNATTLHLDRVVELPESMETLTWHPRGRWVSGSSDLATAWARAVRLIDVQTGSLTILGEHRIKTSMTSFAADGDYLFSGGWDRETLCWDLRTMQRAFTYPATGYNHYWTADGRRCAVVLLNNVIQFYSFEVPSYRSLAKSPSEALHGGRISSDGRWLVACDDLHLCLWSLDADHPATLVPVSSQTTAFFSPDSRELFAVEKEVSGQSYLRRWQLASDANAGVSAQLTPLPVASPKGLTRAAVVDGQMVMTCAEGVRFVALTNLSSGEGRTVRVPAGFGYFSPDGRWLGMLYDFSEQVRIYRLPAVEEVAHLRTANFVMGISFSPDGNEMLLLNRSGTEWFDTLNWERTRRQEGPPVAGSYAFYTPDGAGIWTVTHFRNAALLDRYTLEPRLPLPNDYLPLALSPDGLQVAVSVEGRHVQLWNLEALRRELGALKLDW